MIFGGARPSDRRGSPAAAAPLRRCPSCGDKYPLDFVVCPKDGSALDRADLGDDPLLGEVLGGTFCITRLIGEGGMGRVYEAEHVRLPKRFAVKVMLEELVRHKDAVARFEREALAVARVVHEHVVEVVDLIKLKDGRPCLVTELLEGHELGDLLKEQGRMPLGTALTIARQVCLGVGVAHAAGIVHRDLKPSNLFLVERSDGRTFVKVLDFGVAKLLDGDQLTRTGMVVGTPAYMAPEQALGVKEVDERADVYSIGAVLFHMLTGSPPYVGDEAAVVLTRVLTEDPQRLRDLNRSVPEAVEDVVQRAMARAPEDRPRTVLELERALAAVDPSEGEGNRVVSPVSSTLATGATMLDRVLSAREGPGPSTTSRWRRSGAMVMVLVWTAFAFAAVLATAGAAVRLYSGRGVTGDAEVALLFVVSGIAAVLLLATGARALLSRWRSAAAIDRLGSAFAGATFNMLAVAGVLALALSDYALVGTPPGGQIMQYVEVAVFVAPLTIGLLTFLWGVRRASRTG